MTDARLNPWSESRKRMLTQPGHLYAAYSRGECWIKVGFSLDVPRRLSEINGRFKPLAPFRLIGQTASTYRAERQVHRILSAFRCNAVGLSRELYLAIPEVESVVKTVLDGSDRPPLTLEQTRTAALWSIRNVYQKGMQDGIRRLYDLAARTGYVEVLE